MWSLYEIIHIWTAVVGESEEWSINWVHIFPLVEHRTGIAEVMGSNPVEALIFFRLLLSSCLNWKINCDDHSSLSELSICGRINIVKTLPLSKLVFMSDVMETPKDSVRFCLEAKPPKIKKTTLIKKKSDGRLGMKDFVLFDKALKLTWVKRLCSDLDAPWKYIPKSSLSTVGGTELSQCNYD